MKSGILRVSSSNEAEVLQEEAEGTGWFVPVGAGNLDDTAGVYIVVWIGN